MLTESYNPQPNRLLSLSPCGLDRRIARRYLLNWGVKIKEIDRSGCQMAEAAELQNLSSTGAAVKMGRAVQAGARLELLIRLPLQSEKWIRYCGKALRVQVGDSRTEVAIQFDSARPTFVQGILP